jgi:hypothetical protein
VTRLEREREALLLVLVQRAPLGRGAATECFCGGSALVEEGEEGFCVRCHKGTHAKPVCVGDTTEGVGEGRGGGVVQ